MVTKNIVIPEIFIQKRKGVVVLDLEEYERMKEDLEMMRSKKLAKEIEKSRQEAEEGKIIELKMVEEKLNL